MEPPLPSITPTWHNDVYDAIEYTNPAVSHNGETVIITGAGSGIGRETAVAFATAEAKHLVLIGRTEATLRETESIVAKLGKNATVSVVVADIGNEEDVKKLAGVVESWNVLVLNAGYINTPSLTAQADVQDYWKVYETNVKSLVAMAKYLFPKADPTHAAVIAATGGALVMPVAATLGLSGYLVAKLALCKTIEYLAAENPNILCVALHPGMVDTLIFRKSGATPEALPMDTPKLPAGFSLWVTSPAAKFLTGRLVFANWDVKELKGMEQEIASSNKLTVGVEGWPFPHVAKAPGS